MKVNYKGFIREKIQRNPVTQSRYIPFSSLGLFACEGCQAPAGSG
jgi:hypothetical protein